MKISKRCFSLRTFDVSQQEKHSINKIIKFIRAEFHVAAYIKHAGIMLMPNPIYMYSSHFLWWMNYLVSKKQHITAFKKHLSRTEVQTQSEFESVSGLRHNLAKGETVQCQCLQDRCVIFSPPKCNNVYGNKHCHGLPPVITATPLKLAIVLVVW